MIHSINTIDQSLSLIGVKTLSCQLRAVCEMHQKKVDLVEVDTVAEFVREQIEKIKILQEDELGEIWLTAAEKGRRGDLCKNEYTDCKDRKFEEKVVFQIVQ